MGKKKPNSKLEALVGQVFGKLTVVEVSKYKRVRVRCACDDSRYYDVPPHALVRQCKRKRPLDSCGCALSPWQKPGDSIAGRVYGKLTIRRYMGSTFWEAACSCSSGVLLAAGRDVLQAGGLTSCGYCKWPKEPDTKEKRAWRGMKKRTRYSPRYVQLGISVHPEWAEFENFLRDVGRCPADKDSLGRVDPLKNYEPGNVRWENSTEQSRERTNNIRIEYAGRTMVATDWAREYGLSSGSVITERLSAGWSVEAAITTPGLRMRHTDKLKARIAELEATIARLTAGQ